MTLTSRHDCLVQALARHRPAQSEASEDGISPAGVLAQDLCLPYDMPRQIEALRLGFAVASFAVTGASVDVPIPLGRAVVVHPGDVMPNGCDAVLTSDGTEGHGSSVEAIRPLAPGEGVRHAGHDGRAGIALAPAGTPLTPRLAFVAALAGGLSVPVRRPTLRIDVSDPVHARFVGQWAQGLGARLVSGPADLTVLTTRSHAPRLAYAPAETAWLGCDDARLMLELPARFDGMVAAVLGLGLPAVCHLNGARVLDLALPLARKISSSVGMSELVLLAKEGKGWMPFPAGHVTLVSLARASHFAILPPESEGLPEGAQLFATPIDHPFG